MHIFLHVPKTAGTSFRFVLENSFGISHCHTNHTRKALFTQDDLGFAAVLFPRLQSIAGHNLVDPMRLSVPAPFYMTMLREPVARVISHYQDSVIRGKNTKGFEQSVRENEKFQNLAVKLLAGALNLDRAKRMLEQYHFVGLTEKFELSLHLLERLSPRTLNLNYRKYVIPKDDRIKKELQSDPAMLAVARKYNQLDVELYEFAVGEIFPRLCNQAGLKASDEINSYATYRNALKPRYLACRYINQLFRQLCKLRCDGRATSCALVSSLGASFGLG